MKKLYAYLLLSVRALILHPLRELFTPRWKKGAPRFLANYVPEGCVPYSAEERARLAAYMTCVSCGLCDLVCPLPLRVGRLAFPGPSIIARAYSRGTPDLINIGGAVAFTESCNECRLCETICPRQVPLREIFDFSKRKIAEARALTTSRD